MSSPETRASDGSGGGGGDDAFERKIDEAARSLRGRAPDVLASARAAARDLDASLDAAARALAPPAPAQAWPALRARLADPDAALDAAARAAAPAAPPLPFQELLARARAPDGARRRVLRRRLLLLRGGSLVAAAAAVVLALLLARERKEVAPPAGLTLLSASELKQSVAVESNLAREGDELARKVAGSPGAESDDGQALLEGLGFLDAAIGECRSALAGNELHPQLRQQLADLSRQRVELLRRVEALPSAPPK